MKISIITSTYNSKEALPSALESIKKQDYDDIEHIIIDGASTDGTIELIKEYVNSNANAQYISESDKGIYDALNKGIEKATGDYIGILHSDDLLASNTIISTIVNKLKAEKTDCIYGDLKYVAKDDIDKVIRNWVSGEFTKKKLHRGWMPPHPTLFVKKELFEKYGTYDLQFRIAADYDFMTRILSNGVSISYLPEVVTLMRVGGESNKSIKNIWKKSMEDLKVMRRNNIGGLRCLFMKNFSKIGQFF